MRVRTALHEHARHGHVVTASKIPELAPDRQYLQPNAAKQRKCSTYDYSKCTFKGGSLTVDAASRATHVRLNRPSCRFARSLR
jgi:hypothetical protein